MITSERVAALAACDREALIALRSTERSRRSLALATARGQHRSGMFDGWPHDPAIRALLDAADLLIRQPMATTARWATAGRRWR
jgi:hypothetical protein